MLGIRGVGRDKADYYLSDLAPELPAGGAGQWIGRAAERLGLTGPVDAAAFRSVLEGRHPGTGLVLGSGRCTVAAFDLTFSAPKSASVVFALGGHDVAHTVVAAHLEAVAGSLSYLEEHGITATRRAGPTSAVLPTSGALAAVFTHGISRNADPHIHSHVVLANLVHGADGRWSGCDRRGVAAHRMAASAVYEAQLRAGLTAALGVGWEGSPGRSTDIVGVSRTLLAEFSTRSADIRRHMGTWGAHSARGAHVAWAATRPEKAAGLPYRDLALGWQGRALAVEVPFELQQRRSGRRPALLDEHRFAGVISAPAHGGAHRRDVVAAFGTAATEGARVPVLEHLVGEWVPAGPVGVAEPLHPRRAVVPAQHLLRALGPRPLDPADHDVWRRAAGALDTYRSRWGLTDAREPLGEPASGRHVAGLPVQRLADRLRTERTLAAARTRLGWRDPMTAERGLGR